MAKKTTTKKPAKVLPVKAVPTKPAFGGKFYSSLTRNGSSIREDRARTLSDGVHTKFRRLIEDLELLREAKNRDRDATLDLSPTTTIGLTLAKDFNADNFVNDYVKSGLEIRELTIRIQVAKEGYNDLFGQYKSDYSDADDDLEDLSNLS